MKNVLTNCIKNIGYGHPQTWRNITMVPLLAPAEGKCTYNVLSEALAAGHVTITEISESGSVPELLVNNLGTSALLILDGEELAGAKQNRILNTSILMRAGSRTKIPVSCTEQGRWSYASKHFSDSGNVMSMKSRSKKSRSVHASLKESSEHLSDQGEVWSEIADLQVKAKVMSPTSAMKDVYAQREQDLRESVESFRLVPGQIGMVVFVNGIPVAAEFLSLSSAYSRLHPKLVRSYALDAILEQQPGAVTQVVSEATAASFFEEITAAHVGEFPSVADGTDHRFESTRMTGAALVHGDEVIHGAFFRLDESDTPTEHKISRRRRFLSE